LVIDYVWTFNHDLRRTVPNRNSHQAHSLRLVFRIRWCQIEDLRAIGIQPGCPCEFCVQSRAEFVEGRTPGQELDGLTAERIGDYSAAEVANINPAWISAVEWNFDRSEDLRVFAAEGLPTSFAGEIHLDPNATHKTGQHLLRPKRVALCS
jgi:hypothetical protein